MTRRVMTEQQVADHQRKFGRRAAALGIDLVPAVDVPKPVVLPKAVKPQVSEIEESFALQIAAAKLPPPVREHFYLVGSRSRLDFAWPPIKVGVEVQGVQHGIKGRFKADITKRAMGLLQGWRILEIGGDEVRSGKGIEWLIELIGQGK